MANTSDLQSFRFVIEGIGIPIFGGIGVIGNLLRNTSKSLLHIRIYFSHLTKNGMGYRMVKQETTKQRLKICKYFEVCQSLNILLRCNLDLKLVHKQLITSLLIWDLLFISSSFFLFSMTQMSPESYAKRY